MSARILVAPGERFGRLTVVGDAPSRKRLRYLRVQCDCGSEKEVYLGDLRAGRSKSCGCLRREVTRKRRTSHGASSSPEYSIWSGMLGRCRNSENQAFSQYGGRGITVCERWEDFRTFLADMGPRPSSGHSVDRIDNDKGYSPDNCRWATDREQARNKRNNRILAHNGRTQCLAEWAEELGVSRSTLSWRLNNGWAIARALGA